jgi:hypothetical protein
MKQKWQVDWDNKKIGHYTHSIMPRVNFKTWFEGLKIEKGIITTILRIMSGHCGVRGHLNRFKIVQEPMCVCLEDYETKDHII